MLDLILGQAGRTTLAVCGFYALALVVTLAAFPPSQQEHGSLYVTRANETVYRTEPKYLVLHRAPLERNDPAVLLIGASNVALGFDLKLIEPLFPDEHVHNLGLGGANMSEIAEVVDLVREVVPDDRLPKETFVFGLWYGLFIDDATRWRGGPTDIDIERMRYGLYRRADGKFEKLVPSWALPYAITALRPLLVADLAIKGSLRPLREWFETGKRTKPDLDTIAIDDATKQRKLDEWREKAGSPDGRLRDEQFEVLVSTVRALAARGARVVLIDLPLPGWHRAGISLAADYRERLTAHLASLADLPTVSYRDLQTRFADSEFYDDVHPRPRVLKQWAHELAAAVSTAREAHPSSGPGIATEGRCSVNPAPVPPPLALGTANSTNAIVRVLKP